MAYHVTKEREENGKVPVASSTVVEGILSLPVKVTMLLPEHWNKHCQKF